MQRKAEKEEEIKLLSREKDGTEGQQNFLSREKKRRNRRTVSFSGGERGGGCMVIGLLPA